MLQVVVVLTRHGAASLVSWALRRRARGRPSPAVHLRLAIEELGTTFVKLGQILSTRGDLLPPEYQAELARLQDAAPPEPPGAIARVVEAELRRPLDALFRHFDDDPLAAASIGQAHAAVTVEGAEVVVKVRRPGVLDQVDADLAILDRLARCLVRLPGGRRHPDLVLLVQEFSTTLRAELDYAQEAGNVERFGAAFAGRPGIHVPAVLRALSTGQVLTLERIRGTKITDVARLDAAHVDRADLARRVATLEMTMVFEDGFFHADPHPGNFFVEDDGRIGLIDFGMVGRVDEHTRLQLVDVIGAIVSQDGERLVEAFFGLGLAGRVGDRDQLRADLLRLTQSYVERPLGEISVGPLLGDLLGLVRHHGLRLPPGLALLVKTVAMCEGVAWELDPTFRLTSVLLPFVQDLLARTGPRPPLAG